MTRQPHAIPPARDWQANVLRLLTGGASLQKEPTARHAVSRPTRASAGDRTIFPDGTKLLGTTRRFLPQGLISFC